MVRSSTPQSRRGRQFPISNRRGWALLPAGYSQKLQAVGDAGLLCRRLDAIEAQPGDGTGVGARVDCGDGQPGLPRPRHRRARLPACLVRSILALAQRSDQRAAADAGHGSGARGPAWSRDLAVCARRQLRRQQDPPGMELTQAIWAGNSTSVRSRPRASNVAKSIAAPIRASTAPMPAAAWSA